jgi:ribosomal protein L11 methyltransferase
MPLESEPASLHWTEISLVVDAEAAEAVTALFEQYGEGGAVIEEIPQPEAGPGAARLVAKAFLPAGDSRRLEALQQAIWHLSQMRPLPEPQVRDLGPTDWAEAWKAGFQVLRIGRRLRIVPSWIPYAAAPGEVAIMLDPGMAFGTGLHPSTQLCLQALEELLRAGMRILDVGTGSGILAIAAAKLGAGQVLALDIDPTAVRTARENVARNGVGQVVQVAAGSVDGPQRGRFDGVLANILAEVIARLGPDLARHVAPGGWLVASGIVEPRLPVVEEAFGENGLAIVRRWQSDDWVALEARPQAAGP